MNSRIFSSVLFSCFAWVLSDKLFSKQFKSIPRPSDSSHSLRSRTALRAWRKLQRSCTKLCRQAEIGVSTLQSEPEDLAHNVLDMAATMERLDEYRTYNTQFCKRLYDFLSIMCTAQVKVSGTRL